MKNDNEPTDTTLFENVTIVLPKSKPKEDVWALPLLYKKNTRGKWDVWQTMFDGNNLVTYYGMNGGQIKESKIEIIPKSNRNIQEQAMSEASGAQKYSKQIKKGYLPYDELGFTEDIEENRNIDTNVKKEEKAGIRWLDVMLAKLYTKGMIKRWPVSGEPKLDGIRSYSYYNYESDEIMMISRNHNKQHWLNHIRDDLKIMFELLPENSILDGELYAHGISMNQISSIVRTEKKEHELNSQIKYYIYDISESESLPFDDRYQLMSDAYNQYIEVLDGETPNLILVPSILLFSEQDIEEQTNSFVQQGFEGLIIRQLASKCKDNKYKDNGVYVDKISGIIVRDRTCELDKKTRTSDSIKLSQYINKRGNNLIKFKKTIDPNSGKLENYIDMEGVVVDIIPGRGKKADAAILIVEYINSKTKEKALININPTGSYEDHREWLKNKDDYIGKLYEYRFDSYSEYGVVRFVRGIRFREDLN